MREIKFRGKRLDNGEWVYGCYTFSLKDDRHIIWVQSENHAETWHTYPFAVDGKTIGQYTGLNDKNGKEIYEGDIVTADYNKAILSVVVFRNGQFVAVSASPAIMIEQHSDNLWGTSKLVKIIGNIHENPELLKGETK